MSDKDDIPDSVVSLPGYSIYRCDRVNIIGGGVCIYIKNSKFIKFSIISQPCHIGDIDLLHLNFSSSHIQFSLVCLYRPHYIPEENDNLLFDKLFQMSHNNSNLIICGDFNYSDIDSKSRNFIQCLNNSNLEQLITEHTRFRLNQTPSTLDLLLTNSSQLLTEHEILPPIGNSDHALIGTSIRTIHKSNNTILKLKRVIIVINYSNLDQELASYHSELYFQKFIFDISSLESEETLDQNSTLLMLRQKNSLWKKFKRTRLQTDYICFRTYSNSMSRLIRQDKATYEQNIALNANKKQFYRYVRNFSITHVPVPVLKSSNGNLCDDLTEISETLSNIISSL
ncbi:uncharacterized protein LOC135129908 [Zophobas morio]|uniref:uncharacterized protein LOC135129908 n=1 Tax=Zophobas morio TaxID=2755281 RepID=UPI00308282E5